jgi:hypothetical protein
MSRVRQWRAVRHVFQQLRTDICVIDSLFVEVSCSMNVMWPLNLLLTLAVLDIRNHEELHGASGLVYQGIEG